MEIPEGNEGLGEETMGIPVKHGGPPEETLAAGVAAALERLIGLFRSLSPASGLSLTSAATLATLDRTVAADLAGGPGGRDAAGHDAADHPAGGRGPGRPDRGSG
jgi:hypothetical protein